MNEVGFDRNESIITPKVKVVPWEPKQVGEHIVKGFDIQYEDGSGRMGVQENYGTLEKPYSPVTTQKSPSYIGKLFYSLANNNPDHPRVIYASISGVVFKFDPSGEIPIQIARIDHSLAEENAIKLQKAIMEAIKPGLSSLLN